MIARLLKWLYRERHDFRLPFHPRPLPGCVVRQMREDDFAAGEAIYRRNEPGRFPTGYLEHFSARLREHRALFLVAEVAGEIRGFGGISILVEKGKEMGALEFGMIHPNFHRHGFGTVLLLARIVALQTPVFWRWLYLSTSPAGKAGSFFRRFNFICPGEYVDDRGNTFDYYMTRFDAWDWADCRKKLAKSSIDLRLGDTVVPKLTR
jgi:N-acetylglutamate synthase-like GNAT family acetyltransferase